MNRRGLRVTMMAIALSFPAPVACADRIERRGSEASLDGTVSSVDDNGVTIRSATGAEHIVTWDRVRKVETADPSVERQVGEHREMATSLWRARSRLERGDNALAEPLFERLYSQLCGNQQRKGTHETALIVAEGLLRCRLARAANDTAVLPALEVSRLRRNGVKTIAFATLPTVFDEATSLCRMLPPVWVRSSAITRLEMELRSYDAGGDAVVAAQAAWYRAAARQTSGLAPEDAPKLAEDHVGVSLLRLLVSASFTAGEQRAAARTALEQRLPDLPTWAQAWVRFALGESLLLESGLGQRERGVVSLAYLPSTYVNEQPYLAALALARMSAALASMGDASSAASVRTEVERLFPNHPALQALQSVSGAAAVGPPADAPQPTSTGPTS